MVIPTFQDWEALRETLEGILCCRPRPRLLVVIDDNSEDYAPTWLGRMPVIRIWYPGNRGPSFARNVGVRRLRRQGAEWVYFTDTGCLRAPWFFDTIASATSARQCVAVAGPVVGESRSIELDPINSYMTTEGILNPPMGTDGQPQSVVTANALVSMRAVMSVGGFDETYPFAAGEDLQLGIDLLRCGSIAWCPDAVVTHRFEECLVDFRKRFERYGRGTCHLAWRNSLAIHKPSQIVAVKPELQALADLQVAAMSAGYLSHSERVRLSARSTRLI
ncbi:MAG: glycosyltransferase [Planctomycetota bacterium]|nr:MAG: glycosyltransferase [Planctomycetota bacterium]